MIIFWQGRGFWVPIITAAAMFLPIVVLRQVDGPEVDRGVCLTFAVAAALTVWLGLRWNRGRAPGQPVGHSFWGVPVQLWALPMILFSVLLGTGTITTAEESPRPRGAPALVGGGTK